MVSVATLNQLAFQKKLYVLKGDEQSVEKISKKQVNTLGKEVQSTAETLYKLASEAFKKKSSDFKLLASISFDYTSRHLKKFDSEDSTHLKNLSLLFREKVTPSQLKELIATQKDGFDTSTKAAKDKFQWTQIVLENRLHYQYHAADVELSSDHLSLPVNGKLVNFADVEIEEKDGVKTFKLEGKEIFKTDEKGMFKDYHSHGASGILPGTALKPNSEHLHAPFLKKEPTGSHQVWVCTSFKSPDRPATMGDHTYLGLEDPEGNVNFYGQFGTNEKVSFHNAMRHFVVGVEAPDRYAGLPIVRNMNTQTVKPITKENFETLREQFEDDFKNDNLQGSFLRHNCTNYAVERLGKIGIEIDAKMTNEEWLGRNFISILPKSLADKSISAYEKLPSLAKKVLHFVLVPFYLAQLFCHVVLWPTAYFTEKNKADSDISIFDAIFRPWNVYSNHPLKVYEWQREQMEGKNG